MQYQVNSDNVNERLDAYLAHQLSDESRTQIKSWIKNGDIIVNNQKSKASYKVQVGDIIIVMKPKKENADITLKAEQMSLDICYEDDDLLVVNKPQGLVVHPSPKHAEQTLVNGLVAYVQQKGETLATGNEVFRPGIVHRIDKDTSGLLVVAKSELAFNQLMQQVQAHEITREYAALVYGEILESGGTIRIPICRHPKDRLRFEGNEEGREAITHFKVYKRYRDFTLLHLTLETGRTHQIRVHMQYIKHPIVDDPLYAKEYRSHFFTQNGQLLHAHRLAFKHPRTQEQVVIEAPLPTPFAEILAKLHVKDL